MSAGAMSASSSDGVSSAAACSMADPIFTPLENVLGKRPAKSVSAHTWRCTHLFFAIHP